ncbi:DNA polymerase III subunit beta [Paenibacillus sp. CF384]|uniref:DNA polymerase III subunit beta n=1 Tax=Paenibacillus sp. CF384 TaxID=1884382 RepID=UPI000896DE9D|nr:DNA polymerase III subunit beta [Paenibacillus sp. CF384]SDW97040.1 DNA polymerase III, beta subunit [Paenibacillus sp. CF384]
MFVQVNRLLLLRALQAVAHAASSKSTIPILSGILLTADSSGITVTAGSMGMMLTSFIPAHEVDAIIRKSGRIVVPARYLVDIVRSLQAVDSIQLALLTGLTLTITSSSSRYHLNGMDAEDYPLSTATAATATDSSRTGIRISNGHLKRLIKQVDFAVAASEFRPVLTGVLYAFHGNHLQLVATDGVQLSFQSTTDYISHTSKPSAPVIIPGKHLTDFAKMLQDDEATTDISIGERERTITLRTANFHQQSSLIEGAFPSLDKVMRPAAHHIELSFNTKHLLHALERVAIVAGDSNVVKLYTRSPHSVSLTARTAEIGDVYEEVDAVSSSAEQDVTVYFNGRFMIEIVRSIADHTLHMQVAGAWNPIVIRPANTAAVEESMYMLTPVRSGPH